MRSTYDHHDAPTGPAVADDELTCSTCGQTWAFIDLEGCDAVHIPRRSSTFIWYCLNDECGQDHEATLSY